MSLVLPCSMTTSAINIPSIPNTIIASLSATNRIIPFVWDVAPQTAQQWLQLGHYPHQRPLRSQTLAQYAHQMRTGIFEEGTEITLGIYKNVWFVLNGRHRLTAQIQENLPQRYTIKLIYYDTFEATHIAYSNIDQGIKRTILESLAPFDLPVSCNFTKKQVETISRAFDLLAGGFSGLAIGKGPFTKFIKNSAMRRDFIVKWQNEAHAYFDAIAPLQDGMNTALERKAVMSVALVTFRYQASIAADFWRDVAHDDGLHVGDPRKALHTFLQKTYAKDLHPLPYCRTVAAAWNDAFSHKSRKKLSTFPADTPIELKGTPHTTQALMCYLGVDGTLHQQPVPYLEPASAPDGTDSSRKKEANG